MPLKYWDTRAYQTKHTYTHTCMHFLVLNTDWWRFYHIFYAYCRSSSCTSNYKVTHPIMMSTSIKFDNSVIQTGSSTNYELPAVGNIIIYYMMSYDIIYLLSLFSSHHCISISCDWLIASFRFHFLSGYGAFSSSSLYPAPNTTEILVNQLKEEEEMFVRDYGWSGAGSPGPRATARGRAPLFRVTAIMTRTRIR